MANDRANKRQKSGFGFFQSASDHEAPKATGMQRGQTFVEAIDKLAANKSNESVFAQLDIDYTRRTTKTTGRKNKVTTTSDSAEKVSLAASIGVMRPNEKTDFVQGVLMPMGKTSYFDDTGMGKVVPSTLTLKTAKMEGRAMKFLSMEDAKYTPKSDIVADSDKPASEALTKKGKTVREEKHWGGLALGSFLEEVTGGRGLNISGVGYGMRAMTMAAKWKMRSANTTEDTGFGTRMLKAFPQLGKAAISKHLNTGESLGASALYDDLMKGGTKAAKVREGHLGVGGSIYKAHREARGAAKQRFNDKLQQIQSGSLSVGHGKWWDDKAKSTDFKNADAQELKRLRKEYVETKLGRHAIAVAPKPYELAKQDTSGAFANLGIDKAKDPLRYKAKKHELIVGAMTKAGFAAEAVRAQVKRGVKDNFAAKLGQLQGNQPVKGSWWEQKLNTGTDFKSLNSDQRKTLKQEYLTYQKTKGRI
jgi:hypothetical protein